MSFAVISIDFFKLNMQMKCRKTFKFWALKNVLPSNYTSEMPSNDLYIIFNNAWNPNGEIFFRLILNTFKELY